MSLIKTICVLSLAAALAACGSHPVKPADLTVHQRYETACVSAGTAFGVITAVNNAHPLTAAQQKAASDAYAKIKPRCKLAPGQDYPYSASELVLSELEGAADTLNKIKGEVQ